MTLGNKLPGDCGDMDAFAQKADSRRWLGELDFSWAKQTWMHRFKQLRSGTVTLICQPTGATLRGFISSLLIRMNSLSAKPQWQGGLQRANAVDPKISINPLVRSQPLKMFVRTYSFNSDIVQVIV